MKKCLYALVALVGLLFMVHPAPAMAESVHTLQVEARITTSAQWQPVGDEDGHVIGMGKGEGEAILSNGETAKYTNVLTFDSRRGKGGTSEGYTKFTFADNSLIIFYWWSQNGVDKEGLSTSAGEGTIIKGTGRYAGIQGTSVFTSRQLKPEPGETKRITVANATLNFTLP